MEKMTNETDAALAADLAALDAPSAKADRLRRAERLFDGYAEVELRKLELGFSMQDRDYVKQAWRTQHQTVPTGNWAGDAAAEASRRFRETGTKHIAEQLRLVDIQAVMNNPDRAEASRIQSSYNRQVSAVAISKGNKEHVFIEKFAMLISDRADAEAVGDDAGVRRAETALGRHVGVPYPSLPDAAWDSADQMADAAARATEYRRLEAKYGPRDARKSTRSRTRAGATA
jgi:hypothetical protein